MKRSTRYALWYFGGLAVWALIFFFLRLLHTSVWRLLIAYLLIAGVSGAGQFANYSIEERVTDYALRLRYRIYLMLALTLACCACVGWAVFSRTALPRGVYMPLVGTVVMLIVVSWIAYKIALRLRLGETDGTNDPQRRPR